jgi:predicted component of type VI protein secretion system
MSPKEEDRLTEPQSGSSDALVSADGREFPLVDGLTIGRADEATVQLLDAAISRQHATIRRQASRWLVSDCGSRNGTRVNDVRIPAFTEHPLRDGDRVTVASLTLRVRLSASVDKEATTSMRLKDVAVPLSPYQLQVITMLAEPWLQGREPATNAEIAERLGTPRAVEAVKAALRRSYVKAGLAEVATHTKRRELCRLASERGWI